MADGRIEIDARINDDNLAGDVQRVNGTLSRVGNNMGEAANGAIQRINTSLGTLSSNAQTAFGGMSNAASTSASNVSSSAATIANANEEITDSAQQATRAQGELQTATQQTVTTVQQSSGTIGTALMTQEQAARSAYQSMSAETRAMADEMRRAQVGHSEAMTAIRERNVQAQYTFFQLAQSSRDFTGSNAEFMAQVAAAGAEYKRVQDEMINANEGARMSMIQNAGAMLNLSTQASKISAEYTRMNNPLLLVNQGALAAVDGLNRLANAGSASVLALRQLGPTASMKALLDMQNMITQGMMRFQMVALAATITAGIFYKQLHDGAMESVTGYKAAFEGMLEAVKKAFEPMIQVFGEVMMKVYAFITAIAEIVIKFNEANPTLAKFLQAIIMLVPALTLLLSPLAVGIGLTGGLLAAWNAIWVIIAPLVTGLAAMSATVWIVAAAIVGLTAAIIYLWNNNETFRQGVIAAWEGIKSAVQAVIDFLRPYIEQAIAAINTYVEEKLNQLKEFWAQNGEDIKTTLQTVWDAIKVIFEVAMAVIQPILAVAWVVIKALVVSTWEAIKNVIDGALNVIIGLFNIFKGLFTADWELMWEGIKTFFSGIIELIWGIVNLYFLSKLLGPLKTFATASKSVIQGAWNFIKSIFTKTINAIKTFVTTGFNTMKTTIDDAMAAWELVIETGWAMIKQLFDDALKVITEGIPKAWNNMKTKVSEGMTWVKEAIETGWNKAKDFLTGIDLVEIGKNIIQGLIKGISSMMAAVQEKVADIAGSIKKEITDALDINSPSRWMRDNVGKWIPAGIAVGIDRNMSPLDAAVGDMSARLQADTLRTASGAVTSTTTNVSNSTQPTFVFNSPTALTPSEVQQRATRAWQDMAFQFDIS